MNFYDAFMGPLESKALGRLRKALITPITGTVLEIGAGTGVNLQYYQDVKLTITDKELSPNLLKSLEKNNAPIVSVACDVGMLPFEDETFDFIVSTLVFCSVEDVQRGLSELHRVLKKGGRFIFIEHVLPAEQPSRLIFDAVTPVWSRLAGGCHLNCDFIASVKESAMVLDEVEYAMGTKFVAGTATKP
ncbi:MULTISPECIES: class I SAM-dependent methyltransferase [unclassified Fusibacter]|uniref:class I SAM-dependent methyltransferase n=1 Tax=unclassified Fusibacter TaxID=2624464 RepID=UPI0010138822|nr:MULTISPECIES: class I SAM-dependent methyltransferase [unclassified Fusibacter]MCK8058454.1 class I SAM-dependent methyltransferase [Fusibacter sp. A2]NPE22778.1 class I SAM-dependent methyltransferase [Fusibacter sp. A1]RXV60334.1 class I SAM-dependent methyltransferase [Fusibacter sp. A1]